mmetsp:Transcript_102297/g.259813  ORF Transcript_102297/g.259813 Transcript_102297/m.259813 type:complete len:204 (-) Transcript_102297:281-892(-)
MSDQCLQRLMHSDAEDEKAGSYGTYSVVVVYCGVGLLLVATYVWGVVTLFEKHGDAMQLWGHIGDPGNEWLLKTYYASILAATIGFFPSLCYALTIAPRLPKSTVNLICGSLLGFYVTELFWMPMCVAYIEQPRAAVYVAIRLQLVASGSCVLLWAWAKFFAVPAHIVQEVSPCLRVSGLLGTLVFALHCAIMDATIWPPFFR